MLNKFKFIEMISNDLDLIIFSDVFRLIREETKDQYIDECKITYDYTHLLDDFDIHQIIKSVQKLLVSSFSISDDSFKLGRFITLIDFNTPMNIKNIVPYRVDIDVVNVKYLKENFFISKK